MNPSLQQGIEDTRFWLDRALANTGNQPELMEASKALEQVENMVVVGQ